MIISENSNPPKESFENVLRDSYIKLADDSQNNSKYYLKRSAIDFEDDVYNFMTESAKNTPFEGTIKLISGHRFPDIIGGPKKNKNKIYGVEVKTSKQNHWRTAGNSVLESTRVENISSIYLLFAKLADPISFRIRPYQECLYDVAVTHSPRYLIDMELEEGDSIFDKMGISYDDLRIRKNPILPFVDYYRDIAKPGEEPWWLTPTEIETKPSLRLWGNLDIDDRNELISMSMAYFPEIFGKSSNKYNRLVSWLAIKHGIVSSSLRDKFTAGGQEVIPISQKKYQNIPKIFFNLKNSIPSIKKIIQSTPVEDLKYYWQLDSDFSIFDALNIWIEKLIEYSKQILKDKPEEFIYDFILHEIGIDNCSDSVKENIQKYGLI